MGRLTGRTAGRMGGTLKLLALAAVATVSLGLAPRPPQTFYTRHYTVTTDTEISKARDIARHMDLVYDEYLRGLPIFIDDAAGRSDLYLSEDRDGYIATLAGKGVNGRFTAGIFFARGEESGLATWVDGRPRWQMIQTPQHEGFHQFAHKRIGRLTPWVNEGIAEYFGSSVLVNGKLLTGRVDPHRLERLLNALQNNTYFPIETFATMTNTQWNDLVLSGDPRSQLMYDQAWSYVHFLVKGNRGIDAPLLEQYLMRLSEGLPPADAWTKAFGSNKIAFEEGWKRHLASLEADPLSTAIERLDFLASGLRLLHEQGIEVQTVEQLQQRLQAGQFRMIYGGHVKYEVTAMDAENFRGPEIPGRSRRGRLILEESRNRNLPPTLMITDLLHAPRSVTVVWDREADGELVYDFDFR